MSKTSITVRLDTSVLQEIDSRCNTEFCRSDFIKNAINDSLKKKNEPVSELENIKVSYDDGKTWFYVE